jgi:AsmA-like C-terminal region
MPILLKRPEPATPTRVRPPQAPLSHRVGMTLLRLFIVVLLSALIVGGWYLGKKGFGEQWRSRVVEELHKRGVEASVRRLTLNPFRGLVAQDVRIFDSKHREKTLGLISEVSLDINYAALLHHQPFLNALDVRNAQLTLPFADSDRKTTHAQLKQFRAHVYFPPDQIYVSQAEGIFCGVQVSATGQLINRRNIPPSPPLSEEEWQKRLVILQRIVVELQKFSFPSEHPSLQVKFSGDLAEMENARLEATLRGDRLRHQQYEIHDLLAGIEFADQRLNLTQITWKDAAGTFFGRGSWSRQSQEMNFQGRSSIDLKSFLVELGAPELLADATFKTPPVLDFSGAGNLGQGQPQFKILGHAAVGSFNYKAIPLSDLSVEFSWDGKRTLLRDIHLRHEKESLQADLLDAPNDFRLDLDSTIDPSVLHAFVSPELQRFFSEWQWLPPAVHLTLRGPDRHPEHWQGEGTVALGRTRFRGVGMNSANSKLRFQDGAITYENFRITRDEGAATGSFTYDFKKHEVRIANVKSSLNPADAVFWIDPKLLNSVAPYKFRRPPNVTTNGVYQFEGGKNTRLQIDIDAPAGMDYVFLGKSLPFDRVSAKLIFTNDRLQIADLKGSLFSGMTQGSTDISLAKNDPHYTASISVSRIDFPRLTDLYYQYKTAHGQLSGSYNFTGLGNDARTMRGSGKIEVTNGDVFAIPIFGPLSQILNAVVPGTGYSIARKASASFTIKDGIIHTDDFEAAGKLFSMLGQGDIHFLDDKLNFGVRMDARGAGVLLTPMYKLFEYVGEGSLNHPNWHPKRF